MTSPNDSKSQSVFLGCIADDVTGATDLASNLVLGGMRVVQVFGVPTQTQLEALETDAVVVALKSRSIPAADAISQSLDSLSALRSAGAQRFFFKYCSTFDSTPAGNIGPVAEALMDALNVTQTIFCPSFPRNGRTVYQGHLFVHGQPLNESGMENHPLNPMRDANLVRVLSAQSQRRVGLISYDAVVTGRIREALPTLADSPLVIVDACDDGHLDSIARAVADARLVTGGSGIARSLPEAWREAGQLELQSHSVHGPVLAGRAAILAGSCSAATNRQVDFMKHRCPSFSIDVDSVLTSRRDALRDVETWANYELTDAPLLIYSTSDPERVGELQRRYGDDLAAALESFHGEIADFLVNTLRIRRLIVAGGETAGAVIGRLGVTAVRIGPEICPGVPWTETTTREPLALALKSGNFGADDFFESALEVRGE